MNKIYTHKNLSQLHSLIPQNSGVYVIIDNNLKDYFKFFSNYTIIGVDLSETLKTLSTVEEIAYKLLEKGADRNCFILGVGGGIATDIAGFTASIYKRGVSFGFVPTTLLAQVDASIGGKNGVNFHSYKNILGNINQAQWVYECSDVLKTLHPKEFKAGIAEVLKTFILFDKQMYSVAVDYFAQLEKHLADTGSYLKHANMPASENNDFYQQHILTQIIDKCAQYKCGVVERDEFEKGERRLLNLGHTFAHSIEKLCADKGIMHGQAVSLGLVLAAKVGVALGLTKADLPQILINDLTKVGLPALLSDCPYTQNIGINDLIDAVSKDKKVSGSNIHFIIPKDIAMVEDVTLALTKLKEIAYVLH